MKSLLFTWFLVGSSLLLSLDPGKAIINYNIQNWNMESGLPGNAVFALAQTIDGYLWIGTQDGLVRFDGIHFEVFTRETVPQLKSNDIRALYEDRNGVLWIGTTTGGLTRCQDGEFFTYPAAENNALSRIRTIAEDRWGNLLIGSFTRGLTCFNNEKFTTYTTQQGLPGNQVRSIYKDENQDLWVTTSAGIVKVLKPGTFQTYASHDLLPYLKTSCIYEGETGNLWIGTGERGLFRLKNGNISASEIGAVFKSSTINTLYRDRQENLWIGTDGGHLIRLNGGAGLACGSVYAIAEDNEGCLWVGTLDRGLFQLRDSNFVTYTARDGLSHDIVHSIYAGLDNTIWIGTDGGVDRIKNGNPVNVLAIGQGRLNTVSCLSEDNTGCLWIGTVDGLHKFKAGKLTTFTARKGLSDNRIKCILIDTQGNTWIGTENGLNRYDSAAGKFEIFNTGRGLSGNSIEFIYEDNRGDLWIGAGVGLNRLSGGKISPYKLPVGKEAYFPKCAYQDNEGTLWLGTDRGLVRVLGKENTPGALQVQNTRFRLTETEVNAILEDDRGYLWLAGGKGISRVDKKELMDFAFGKIPQVNMEIYNEKDGMKSRWVIGLGCKSRDGRLWFPTSMGVAVIDPGHIEKDSRPLSPIIEKFLVDGEIIRTNAFQGLRSGGDGLSKKPPRPKTAAYLELGPGKKRLEFYYTAVSFINPQKIKFKIKLEGYDSDWEDVGVRRNSSYNGLAPGYYTFKVKACNRYGKWSAEPATFSFYLRPYFYQTTWFYVSVVFIAILAVFTFHRFRFRRLRARARELEMMVAERTEQLAAANKELSRLANLDPLTGIANRRRFMEYLTVEWQREIRSSGTIAIVMIDVDFFKKYNDSYGHQAGDECLRKVAGVIASAARRPGDMAARYGGEEFVVVLPGSSREGACKAAENIKDGVEALEILHTDSATGFVTISLGVSLASPRQGELIENLISLADRALYLAKEQGRNRVCFVPPRI